MMVRRTDQLTIRQGEVMMMVVEWVCHQCRRRTRERIDDGGAVSAADGPYRICGYIGIGDAREPYECEWEIEIVSRGARSGRPT